MCSCATSILKYAFITVNLAFSILGITIIALGITAFTVTKDLQEILPIDAVTISIIVLGCSVFLLGFLACCGAVMESKFMLVTFIIIVSLLLAGFIFLMIIIMSFLSTIEQTFEGWMVAAFDKEDLREVFNIMEGLFHCCGTIGPASYTLINQTIPSSCCASPSAGSACLADDAFQGCGTMVGNWMGNLSGVVRIVLIVIIIVQLMAIVFALFLNRSIAVAQNQKKLQAYRTQIK